MLQGCSSLGNVVIRFKCHVFGTVVWLCKSCLLNWASLESLEFKTRLSKFYMILSCSYSSLAAIFCLSRVPWRSAVGTEIHLWNILPCNLWKNLLTLQVSFSEEENLSKPCRMGTVGRLMCTGKGRVWSRYVTAGFSCLWKGKRMF